jgi:hypothetical protein
VTIVQSQKPRFTNWIIHTLAPPPSPPLLAGSIPSDSLYLLGLLPRHLGIQILFLLPNHDSQVQEDPTKMLFSINADQRWVNNSIILFPRQKYHTQQNSKYPSKIFNG